MINYCTVLLCSAFFLLTSAQLARSVAAEHGLAEHVHNTLIATGPDFRKGFVDELPTGNADLAPTILSILGIKDPGSMDGRILQEALVGDGTHVLAPESTTLKAACDVGFRHWEQYLKLTKMGNQVYFDEGDGDSVIK